MVLKIKSEIDTATGLFFSPKFGFWCKAPNGIVIREVHVNLTGSLIKIRCAVNTRVGFA